MTSLNDTSSTTPRSGPAQIGGLVFFLLLCWGAGWLGTLATTPNIPTWYAGLEKPWFNPPNSVFPVAWGILYTLMAIAGWLVWRSSSLLRGRALTAFAGQLILNVAWSFAFFGAQNPLFGFVVILALLVAIVWTIVTFWPVSRTAAVLLIPYVAWVAFATVLNGSILYLNGAAA